MHNYTVHLNDAQQGPFTADELVAKLNAGEALPSTLTWRPGLAEWGELATVLRQDGALPPEPPGAMSSPLAAGVRSAFSSSEMPPCPKNWLVPAILSTVCCCLPVGIPGIVYASQVDPKYRAGDYEGARKAAANAKLWTLIAVCLGLLVSVVYVGFSAALAVPAFTKVRNNAIEKTMMNDARQIASAAHQVMAEEAKTSVTVGEVRKYVPNLSSGVTLVITGTSAGDLSSGTSDTVVLKQADRFSLRHHQYRRALSTHQSIKSQAGPDNEIEFEVTSGAAAR